MVDGNAVVLGGAANERGLHQTRISSGRSASGSRSYYPNPQRADRYIVVVEGVDALGTWRSLSLPDLLPDFIVWDERIAFLGAGKSGSAPE